MKQVTLKGEKDQGDLKVLNERTIAYYLCRVNFHAIAVCDTHYLNTCNFVILWKFLIKFHTATQCIVIKIW